MEHRRSSIARHLCVVMAFALFAGCGGGGGGGDAGQSSGGPGLQSGGGSNPPDNNNNNNNGPTEVNCDALDLGDLVAGLATHTPTWEELECFTEDLERFERPAFIKRILLGSDTLPENSSAWSEHLNQVEQTWTDWPINVGNTLSGPLPPYDAPDGRQYPLSDQDLDLVMRSYATVLLYEKLEKGRAVFFSHFWPPSEVKEFNSFDEYDAWMTDVFLPEIAKVAEAAEFVKAEYFSPFILEVEVFAAGGAGPWVNNLSQADQVAIAQDYLDRIFDAVRPVYSGTLVAHSYGRYEAIGDHWQNVSYSDYDQINFGLFPECNLEVTGDYLDDQFDHYMNIVARDGKPYMINELTVYREKSFENLCPSFNFEANADELYQLILDKIDALPIQPVGLSAGAPATEDARAVLRDWFNAH